MIIKKIKLKNIRSYTEQEIKFPEGTILLSGEIGAGKSTILLAAEFCLFGIMKGEISGSSLLRKGCTDGFADLTFSTGEREISIKRTLKKTSNGIAQNAGFLTINDVTQEFTPVELKQKILEILNYPAEALTKKSLIFRYTVYTPQEDMKIILLGDKEARLQTLRRVFSIDKYKKIKDNLKIITAEIKERKREIEGFVSDLGIKKEKLNELENSAEKLESQKVKISEELNILNKKIEERKNEYKNLEEQNIKIIHLKKDLENFLHRKTMKNEQKTKLANQLKFLEDQINKTGIKEPDANISDIIEKIKHNEAAAESIEKELKRILEKLSEIKTKKSASEEIKNSIRKLDFCPLCRQKVSENHKHEVSKNEENKIAGLENELKLLLEEEGKLTGKIKNIKEEINKYQLIEKNHELNKLKLKEVESKKAILDNIKNELIDIDIFLTEILNSEEEVKKSLDSIKNTEEIIKKLREELDKLILMQRGHEITLASSEIEIKSLKKQTDEIMLEIEKKTTAQEKINYYIKLLHWIDNNFFSMVDVMEKRVMSKVRADFDALLQKWVEMLADSDTIKVRLDEEFTPLIEQNSHDIEYENLSGGEKTACALAYRLALNQVINNMVSSVNTRDIIILDEPTDGFSSEQIDKIKNVLEELKMKQIIIVSHEPKIEAFADRIIKVEKRGHTSRVLTQ